MCVPIYGTRRALRQSEVHHFFFRSRFLSVSWVEVYRTSLPKTQFWRKTRATIESAPFFFSEGPQFGSLRPLLKNNRFYGGKTKNRHVHIPDEKSHGLGTQRESCKKKCSIIYFFSDDFFGLRSPLVQKPFSSKQMYTSIVARVQIRNVHSSIHEQFYVLGMQRCVLRHTRSRYQ